MGFLQLMLILWGLTQVSCNAELASGASSVATAIDSTRLNKKPLEVGTKLGKITGKGKR